MTKAIIPSSPKKLKFIGTAIKKETERVARVYMMQALQDLVAPLHSNISFKITIDNSSDDYKLTLHGVQGDTASIKLNGDSVSSHDLMMFLDQGTSVRYAHFPDGYERETRPGSLSASRVENDMTHAYVNKDEPLPGLEPREFYKAVYELYKGTLRRNIDRVVTAYLNS